MGLILIIFSKILNDYKNWYQERNKHRYSESYIKKSYSKFFTVIFIEKSIRKITKGVKKIRSKNEKEISYRLKKYGK